MVAMLNLSAGDLTGETPLSALWRVLTDLSETSGENRPKGLLPTARGDMKLYLGGLRRSERFSAATHTHVLEILRSDYDRIKTESQVRGDNELYLRVAGYWQRKYGFDVRSKSQKLDGIREPKTTIGDTFVEGSDVDLSAHTATGPNGGFSWTAVHGDINVTAASDDTASANNANNNYRAESDLSSDDQDVEVDVISNGGASDNHGPVARFASAAQSFYTIMHRDSDSGRYRLFKFTAGTPSQIGSSVNAASAGEPINLRLRVDGSSLEAFVDDVSVIGPNTDTSFTGQTRTGILQADTVILDNFEAADLAVGAQPNSIAAVARRKYPF